MLEPAKFLPIILIWCCYHDSFAVPPFDSFHSNLGEIIILTPTTSRTLYALEVKPESQKIPAQNSAENVESKEVEIDADSAQGTQSKEKENKTTLSDKEINDLLFDELFEWEEEEDELLLETSDWYKFYAFELGGGYADNPLGAAHNPESSSFGELNLESFFISKQPSA